MNGIAHRGVTLSNARLGTGELISLRIEGARIVDIAGEPAAQATCASICAATASCPA